MNRPYKEFIKSGDDIKNYAIVVSRDEIPKLRNMYDNKYTLKVNRLQNGDVLQGRGMLQGVRLVWGEWI